MSKYLFTPGRSTIIFQATVSARRTINARLALDTGATLCKISNRIANYIGLDLSSPIRHAESVTASDVVQVPVFHLPSIDVLGKTATRLDVVVRDMPPQAGLDGALGLNFFLSHNLFINYGKGVLVIQDGISKSSWNRFSQAIELWSAMK